MPNYEFVNGSEIIARVDVAFTIDFSDWMVLAPLFILDGLLEIGTPVVLTENKETIQVEDYAATLPIGIKGVSLIEYKGKRLPHIESVYPKVDDTITGYTEDYYTHRNGRVITTSFKEGEIIVYYKQVPLSNSPELGISLPDVPNDINVIQALANYIMIRLLQKGYHHPTLNLRDNNPYLNPGVAFENYAKRARNSLGAMSYDQRVELSDLMHDFVSNYRYANTENVGHLNPQFKKL